MKLVVGLLACCSIDFYKKQIEACQETWCKKTTVPIYFFTGEACPYGKCDGKVIHLPNVGDDVKSATYKQWYGLRWLYEHYPHSDFFYLAGTDTYAKLQEIEKFLAPLDPTTNLYIGGDGFYRNINGVNMYFHSGGPGFILSNNLIKTIYNMIPEWIERWNRNEYWTSIACDWSLAALFIYNNIPVNTIKLTTFKACNWKGIGKDGNLCCSNVNIKDIWVCHYMYPQDMIEVNNL